MIGPKESNNMMRWHEKGEGIRSDHKEGNGATSFYSKQPQKSTYII